MNKDNDWFIAVVTPNTEKSCAKKLDELVGQLKLEKKGGEEVNINTISSYVPIQRELHEWPSTGKRVWIDKVLCPCYIFIQCTEKQRYEIACKAKFILHFMMDRARKKENGLSEFARIPHNQMLNFKRMVGDAEFPVTIDTDKLKLGSKVRVKSGRWEGMEGFIYREPTGTTQLAIQLNCLGYAKTEFPLALLELIEE